MKKIILSLGSNIGDKRQNINNVVSLLAKKTTIKKISSFYLSSPTDYAKQKSFLNCCVYLETNMMIDNFFSFCRQIERKMKSIKKIFKGPRIVDVDILFYENWRIKRKDLSIPHPRYSQRLFVLIPLQEVFPEEWQQKKKQITKILNSSIKINFLGQKINKC